MQFRQSIRLTALLALQLLPALAVSDELRYAVTGVGEPLLSNVHLHLESFRFAESSRLAARRFDELRADAEERVRAALKPYGFYQPEVVSSMRELNDGAWEMRLQIQPGPPLRIAAAEITLLGAGAEQDELRNWRRDWPLTKGSVLNQLTWEEQKKSALSLAEAHGYLSARFSKHRIAVDLAENSAALALTLDTGEQAVFGEIIYEQEKLYPWVLENIPRFYPGKAYSAELLEQFRLDLWRTGYFTDLEVREDRRLKESPPVVDLRAILESDKRDIYQGTLGFGTDTGIRLQGLWGRHRLSPRGDRIDIGTGYREIDDEISVRADYRVPRRTERRQYWIASASLRSENQDLEFKRDAFDENFVQLANGQVDDINARLGRLYVRDRKQGFQQIFETVYVQLVRETFDYRPGADADPGVIAASEDPRFAGIFKNTINTIALGIEWDWPTVRGQGFATEGHREQAWIFTANDAWGSERTFSQIYASSRRSYLYGDRFKLLLSAEIGYSDAEVRELSGTQNGEPFSLSVSQLPDTYRFKAGGSSSVRGYDFQSLSNNDIGSNHIVTGSAEIEMKVAERWSVAGFADIGNAFNDWGTAELRKGIGFGVRWYSVAGAIRLDFARGLDIQGKPWRIHFTMGSPLL
ncbi:MAG: BamA/TamA family outer membrane protein [Woeseia sp.]